MGRHFQNGRPEFQEAYEQVLRLLLEDYTRSFPGNAKLFHDTFFDRSPEILRFRALLEGTDELDQMFIVTGRAGVGKTSFVYRLAFDPYLTDGPNIAPILADYRAAVPQTVAGCIMGFIHSARERFDTLGVPIEGLQDNTPDNVPRNVRTIYEHIEQFAKTQRTPRVVVFLDDFDYAESLWYELLDYFLPFVQSTYCAVVLSMRPPLRAAIKSYDDRIGFYFGRNVHEIQLNPIPAREVLAARLAPILAQRETQSMLSAIINRFKEKGPTEQIVARLGLKRLEDLEGIDFPFTEKHNDFMHRITNGNLREVLDIATESLSFIIRAGNALERREEKGFTRTVIGRDNVLRLFLDNPDAHFRMININKYPSRSGNSLLYNTLEGVRLNSRINEELLRMLRELGHSEDKVRWAVKYLADKTQRLLEEKWVLPPGRAATVHLYEEYEVTDKGLYYLDIAKWDEYRARVGHFGKSLIEEVKP